MSADPVKKSVALLNASRAKKEELRLLQELEFCVRNKVDPVSCLKKLDSFRASS